MLPSVIARSRSHHKRIVARQIKPLDFEVTTIIRRDHLAIERVWAKGVDYFREKLFYILIQICILEIIN